MTCVDATHGRKLCAAQWFVRGTVVAILSVVWTTGGDVARAQPAAPAQGSPPSYNGIWFDDTGQGAIEIAPCAEGMCGRVVWLRSPLDKSGKPLIDANNPDAKQRSRPICGLPILGGLKRQRDGSWDEGWIYDPKQGKQFDLELRMRAPDALQVTGYLGVKFLSETFIWKRAPADIKRCA